MSRQHPPAHLLVSGPRRPGDLIIRQKTEAMIQYAYTTRVADVLWQDYRQPICAGARAWVRRHYGEWVNDKQEAEDRSVFELGVHQANLRRARGGANAQLRVRAHPF